MSDAWTDPLLPPAQTRLEAALGRSMPAVGLTPEIIATLWNPWAIPPALLPWLAWALSVDEWEDAWSDAAKRQSIADSIAIHKRKGTVWAVKRAIGVTGYRATLTEAWQTEPPGVPHTFRVDVEIGDRGLDDAALASIERRIDAAKPERSHYDVRLIARSDCAVHAALVTLSGDDVSIYPLQISTIDAPDLDTGIGIGLHSWGHTSIYPIQ